MMGNADVDRVEAPLAIWLFAAALIIGLTLRVAVATIGPIHQVSDAGWYMARATDLAAGHGYVDRGMPTAFWPVGWPAALAALFFVVGPSSAAVKAANVIMAMLVLLLTGALGARLTGNRLVGASAALLMAVYPNAIGYVPFALTEIFYQMLLLAALWLLTCRGAWAAVAAGLVFGLATLTKAQTLVVPLFLFSAPMIRKAWRAQWQYFLTKKLVIVYFGMLIVVLPWTWRNAVELHAFIPVSTNGGWTLLTGNNQEARGTYTPNTVLAEGLDHDPADQVAMDRLARDRAFAWIKAHPMRFLELLPLKAWWLWGVDGETEWAFQISYPTYSRYHLDFEIVRFVNQIFYGAMLLLALPAALRLFRGAVPLLPWTMSGIAMVGFTTLLCLAFSGEPRLHFDVMPLIAIMSASTLTAWLTRGRRRLASITP